VQALVKTASGTGNVSLQEVSEPACRPGYVKIKVRTAGVCGTDIHHYHDRYPNRPPVILGHEFCGEVVEVGEGVESPKTGDRVVVNPSAGEACGKCRYCHTGHFFFCVDRSPLGSILDGGFAPYAVVRQGITYRLPEWTIDEAGALCEPLACAYQAVMEVTTIRAGDVVLVTGPGAMGAMCAVLSRKAGATVIVTGLGSDAYRLGVVRQLGIPYAVNVEKDNPAELLKDLTGGHGADVVMECAGSEAALDTALRSVRALGSVTQVGLQGGPVRVDVDQVVTKQIRFHGSICHTARTWDSLMQFIVRDRFDPGQFVTHRRPIPEWAAAFEDMEECRTLKTVLYP